jgi:hydrogenase expression/formation protein HypD
MTDARHWLEAIRRLPLKQSIRILNVCGGHESTVAHMGLRSLLPSQIEIIPGPGCPVCVCPEEDIYAVIEQAMSGRVIVASFGDMLRVPVNAAKSSIRSLEQARAHGASVVPLASPLEIHDLAAKHPDKEILFFAVGFETTTAPIAACIQQGLPSNVRVHSAARRTSPIVRQMLTRGEVKFDAMIAPGHVATIMGANEWEFVADDFQLPVAVAGFQATQLAFALYTVIKNCVDDEVRWTNCYAEAARDDGNPFARAVIQNVFSIADCVWRGIGIVPESGYVLKPKWQKHDAGLSLRADRYRAGQMPAGCECADVIMGRTKPDDCPVYGKACTPTAPIGPCMVSDEGACRIWWNAGIRKNVVSEPTALA